MKKLIALLLTGLILVALCACGGNNQNQSEKPATTHPETTVPVETEMSLDDMLASAKNVTLKNVFNDFNSNKARAKSTYFTNDTYLIWGFISSIGDDYADIRAGASITGSCVRAYLPNEELIKLDTGSAIEIVGIFTEMEDNVISMKYAHFVNDVYEINNAKITSISLNNSDNTYTCAVSDENFGVIYIKAKKGVTNEQWTHYEKYTLSASGTLSLQVVYGFEKSALMDSSTVTLTKK